MQVGHNLPIPISPFPAKNGPINFGQRGLPVPTALATIMQTNPPGATPPALTLGPTTGAVFSSMQDGIFHFGGMPPISKAIFSEMSPAVFAVQTDVSIDFPHPGFDELGVAAVTQQSSGPIPTGALANKFFVNGRLGAPIVSYYANATAFGTSATNFGNLNPPLIVQTPMAGEAGSPPINGVARFSSVGDQFGGAAFSRLTGTAKVFRNTLMLGEADLPCKVGATPMQGTNAQGAFVPFNPTPNCVFALSIVDFAASDATVGVVGGQLGALRLRPSFVTPTGFFTATIGYQGTILGTGAALTDMGVPIPFTASLRQRSAYL